MDDLIGAIISHGFLFQAPGTYVAVPTAKLVLLPVPTGTLLGSLLVLWHLFLLQ